MRNKYSFIAMLVLVVSGITGCESTVHTDVVHVHEVSPPVVVTTEVTTTEVVTTEVVTSGVATGYDLASVYGMAPGEWLAFDLAGYDSYGDYWHGSVTRSGLNARWVDGVWATPTVTEMELFHGPSGGTVRRSSTLYLDQYGQEVKLTMDNGLVCYPKLINDIPDYSYAGDYGDLGIMVCSDGSELHGIWDLYSNPDHSADFVTLSTLWFGGTPDSSTEVTQRVNPDGLITGYAVSLYVPEYGVTVWLDSL